MTLRTTFRDTLSSRQIALIGLPWTKNARRIFAIVSTISIPTSASKNHGSHCGPSARGPDWMPITPKRGALFHAETQAVFSILIYVLDYDFPILLQLMRIPLLAARAIGDGMAALFEGVTRCLPVSSANRDAWRRGVREQWIWLRRKISYQAFEHALHQAFEAG